MARKKVDFAKLFLYSHELEITKNREVVATVYQRLLNDADLEYARSQALRASGKLRKKLSDPTSDEYVAYIAAMEDLDREDMVAGTLIQDLVAIRRRVTREVLPIIPKKPKDDSLEAYEKYQEEIDKAITDRSDIIEERVNKAIEEREAELQEVPSDQLVKLVRRGTIENLCQIRMVNTFRVWCVFLGTYSDEACKKRYFKSYEEVTELPTEVLEQMVIGYDKLDMGIDEIKKSQEAMPSQEPGASQETQEEN